MWTAKFWKETAERAIKSAAQAAVGLFVGDVAFDIWQMDLKKSAGVVLAAALLSVLTSIATAGVGAPNSPSAV